MVGSPTQQRNNVKRYRAQATLLAPIVALAWPISGTRRRTRLRPVHPCAVLERLSALGLCSFPAPDANALASLVAWLDGVPCWELAGADLWRAAELLRDAAGGTGSNCHIDM